MRSSVPGGQRLVPIFSCLHHSSKCIPDLRGIEDLASYVLRKPSFSRSGDEILTHQEDHYCSNRRFLEAASLISSKPYPRHDGPTNQESNEQTRHHRPNGTMGSQAELI